MLRTAAQLSEVLLSPCPKLCPRGCRCPLQICFSFCCCRHSCFSHVWQAARPSNHKEGAGPGETRPSKSTAFYPFGFTLSNKQSCWRLKNPPLREKDRHGATEGTALNSSLLFAWFLVLSQISVILPKFFIGLISILAVCQLLPLNTDT